MKSMTGKQVYKIDVRLTRKQYEHVLKVAASLGISKSQLIRELIDENEKGQVS